MYVCVVRVPIGSTYVWYVCAHWWHMCGVRVCPLVAHVLYVCVHWWHMWGAWDNCNMYIPVTRVGIWYCCAASAQQDLQVSATCAENLELVVHVDGVVMDGVAMVNAAVRNKSDTVILPQV